MEIDMKTKVVLFLILTFFVTSLHANNVQLAGTVNIISAGGGTVTMEVDLSWDNSWRDDYNWDAVWLFFKYKQGVDGAWQHAVINASTATVTGGDYTTMSGSATSAAVQGLFVYPSKERGGNTGTLKVQVQWASSYTKAQFDNNDVFVVCHGIEMVYIPYGAYTIGDGSSANALTKTVIDSEAAWNTANANFPKGYQGFYVMKYETSQEQYVEFLNTLTLAQQTALIPGVDALNVGNFVFGANKTAPNYRNGVILSAKQTGKPLMFDNNLNNNKQYSEDGDGGTLAMNYMSISDAAGYASWAGLRPLTEMEYEKACRRPFPQEPDAGEYAWNSATGAMNAGGLTLVGSGREVAASGNVNAGNGIQGPVRCGIFARPTTATQTAAGATYWGVMEMSGNVSELCANITNTTISKTGNGTGTYNATFFGSTPSTYGTRGGGFSDTHTTLATSDRSAVSRFTNVLQRDSSVGFRCAYTYGAAGTVDAGTLTDLPTICPGATATISGTPASAGTVNITGYIWNVNDGSGFVVIPSVGGATLVYSNFVAGKKYVFKRKAICPLGEKEVISKSYVIPDTAIFTISPLTATLENCSVTSVTASGANSYSWKYNGTELMTTAGYTPAKSHFGSLLMGDEIVSCTGVVGDCPVTKNIKVTLNMEVIQTFKNCGDLLTDDCRYTYETKLMNDGRCWMTRNLRSTIGTLRKDFYYPNNSESYAAVYGCHYSWPIAMNGSSSEKAQGICPAGWHIPSDGEWKALEMAYGMTQAEADKANVGRGTTQGTQFKPGGSSGFNMTLSGVNGLNYLGERGYYWSSSLASSTNVWDHYVFIYETNVFRSDRNPTDVWVSVRCVKN